MSSGVLLGKSLVKSTTLFATLLLLFVFASPFLSTIETASAESGNALHVDVNNCSSNGNGSISSPFCSIIEAVTASTLGDTISVSAGTYVVNNSIEITHPLLITGAKDGTSALQRQVGAATETIIDIRNSYGGFSVRSSDVSISGFDILGNENTRWGIYIAGNTGNLSNIEISDNFIHGMAKKQSTLRSTSWGILTDAKPGGAAINTLSGLHIHGNHIFDLGGYNDSIGLGISLHEVNSENESGGALIENNRFSNIHDGIWYIAGVPIPTPGMGVFSHEQSLSYTNDYQGGVTLQNNQYDSISVGATLQLSDGGLFDEDNTDFQNVDVYLINVGATVSVDENSLAPFARTDGTNLTLSTGTSTAYFASPSAAVLHTLTGSQSTSHNIELSSGMFDETLTIAPSSQIENLHITALESSQPVFTGGVFLQSNYLMDNISIEGLLLQGEATNGSAITVDSLGGISNFAIRDMVIEGEGNSRSGISASGLRGNIEITDNYFYDLDGDYVFTSTPVGNDPSAGQITSLEFSGNTIEDSSATINIEPGWGAILSVDVLNNQIRDSGSPSSSMITISSTNVVLVEGNSIENISSTTGVELQDVGYVSVLSNDVSEVDTAFSIDQVSQTTLQVATFSGNSFSEINDFAIDVPQQSTGTVSVESNWFGTMNESTIMGLIDGDYQQTGEHLNSPPGNDADGDGWADEFDLCEGHNDAVDQDADGIPDGCDNLIDIDNDLVGDNVDNCPLVINNDQANHDGDIFGDACDPDDDNDFKSDDSDDCPFGFMGWVNTDTTDFDNDGCHDSYEDDDDDNDLIPDIFDNCRAKLWISTNLTDYDQDGCEDSTFDSDDDNDGILDVSDDCPKGTLSWASTKVTDFDGDGCKDSTEDSDDDDDGIFDAADDCPNEKVNEILDEDGDGCIDVVTEKSTFMERLLKGDAFSLALVFIPIILLFSLVARAIVVGERKQAYNRLSARIASAESAPLLKRAMLQANELFSVKSITSVQYEILIEAINARQEEYGGTSLEDLDEIQNELEAIFAEAIAAHLTTAVAVNRMRRHIESGRFTPEHYLAIWKSRLNSDGSHLDDVAEAVDEVVKSAGKSTALPTSSELMRLKKAELVDLAKSRGVSHTGTKADIVDRLTEEE